MAGKWTYDSVVLASDWNRIRQAIHAICPGASDAPTEATDSTVPTIDDLTALRLDYTIAAEYLGVLSDWPGPLDTYSLSDLADWPQGDMFPKLYLNFDDTHFPAADELNIYEALIANNAQRNRYGTDLFCLGCGTTLGGGLFG